MRAALLVSLLSVWVLVGLFYYLNRYTKRYYFTIWTAAWLFYALWLTMGITLPGSLSGAVVSVLRQWCVSISATFLLWGSLSFLDVQTPQKLFGLFILFLLTWGVAGPNLAADPFYVQLPTFILIGLASMFAGGSFYRLRQRRQFVAVGMLFLGFFLWGVYLISYPFSQKFSTLINAGFLFSAVLQLFIAVSMIVLVLEESRHIHEQVVHQIEAINSEKRELQLKVVSAEEQCRSLFGMANTRSELQSAYDELRQTQQSVVQQERLRALGQMASGIAHDVNNALSPILAFSELVLKKEPNLAESSRKHLQTIHTAAEGIAHIVARMREFHRRREQRDQLKLVPVKRLVEQVVELTSPGWRDIPQSKGISIRLETSVADPLPELYCNESEIQEALTNLVLNAVDAMPQGGTISFKARGLNQGPISSSAAGPSHLVLEVVDTGLGMDDKTRQRCLEPFFSTKHNRGGSGLGLAMVYGTMERHDGQIEVQSEPGNGTTMRLVFPFRQPPSAAGAAQDSGKAMLTGLRLLCIDDEPLLRELLKEVLEFQKHTVETAETGEAGLNQFQQAARNGRGFDAVITDLGMPGVNGMEVARRIKAESPATPVILLTGWGAIPDEEKSFPIRVDAVLSKPPRMNDLKQTLEKLVRNGHPSTSTNSFPA